VLKRIPFQGDAHIGLRALNLVAEQENLDPLNIFRHIEESKGDSSDEDDNQGVLSQGHINPMKSIVTVEGFADNV
jgi:hypothetical protein